MSLKTISLLLLFPFVVLGQKELSKNDLPKYIQHDTVILKDAYVKDIREEAKDKKKMLDLNKKIERLKALNKNKQSKIKNITKNIVKLENLVNERDSLIAVIDSNIHATTIETITLLENQITALKIEIKEDKETLQKLRRRSPIIIGVAILEGVLIVLLI